MTTIGFQAFQYNQISSVNFDGCTSLTNIAYYAFNSNSLTSVDLSGLSALTSISQGLFYNNQLTSIDLTACTALTTIDFIAFAENSITTIRLPKSITSINQQAFSSNSITSVCYEAGVGNVSLGYDAFDNFDTELITTCVDTLEPTLSPTTASSIITTIAGTGSLSYHEEDGAATSATFQPLGIAVDAADNVYFNDVHNNVIRKVTVSTGIITTYAGSYSQGFGGDGGQAISATLCTPLGLCIDSSGTSSIHRLTSSML